jgi:hypothetical protein
MTQQEITDALKEDMKYAGFGERHNDLIDYHVKRGTPDFQIVDEALIGNHRVEHTLHFRLGTGKDGERHYYNGMQSTLYAIEVPREVINGIDTADLEALLQKRPKITYNDMLVGMDKFNATNQAYIINLSNRMQVVAQGDPDTFNMLMVKYNPEINFAQDPAWADVQKEIRENQTRQQFFKWSSKRITSTEAPNLLYGRAVNKDLFDKNGNQYNSWLQIDFNSKKTDSGNYQWHSWHEKRGFNISDKIDEFNFKFDSKSDLIKNLRKGFQVEVIGIKADKSEEVLVIEANPEKKTITIYDSNGDYAPHNLYKKTQAIQKKSSVVRTRQQPSNRQGGTPESSAQHAGADSAPAGSQEPDITGKNKQSETQQVSNDRQHTAQSQVQNQQVNKHSGPRVIHTNKNKHKGMGHR